MLEPCHIYVTRSRTTCQVPVEVSPSLVQMEALFKRCAP